MANKSGLMHLDTGGLFQANKVPAAATGELLTERQPPNERRDDQ
jgi:hypothetical protein